MAIAVARRGTQLTIPTDGEITPIAGTTKYSVALRIGNRIVTGVFDRGASDPLTAYYLGHSAYEVTYRLGIMGGLHAETITLGLKKPYPLKRR